MTGSRDHLRPTHAKGLLGWGWLWSRTPSAPAVAAETIPAELGEYQLLEKLGEGGVGSVFKARHVKLDRIVAVKTLGRRFLDDEKALARFEREMRAVGRLDHPNVVRAHDAREFDGLPVLVMEYVDGLDLGQVVRLCGPLPVPNACEAIRQAAMGLQAAHDLGLVHRDIKPSNLILDQQGVIKILDLGLARFQTDPVDDKELTGSEQTMGTADYIAPEQVCDTHAADIRSDIYALGCTFYKLLTGHAPFCGPEHRTCLQKMLAHVHKHVPPVSQLRYDVPPAVDAIVTRMAAQAPPDRFPTPGAVVQALTPFCAGADLLAQLAQARERAPLAALSDPSHVATEDFASSELLATQEGPGGVNLSRERAVFLSWVENVHAQTGPVEVQTSPVLPWRRMALTTLAFFFLTLALGWWLV